MRDHKIVQELLPSYATHTLTDDERKLVDSHISEGASCRKELALWEETAVILGEENASLSVPPRVFEQAWRRIATPAARPNVWRSSLSLLRAQVRLVRREIWLASLLVNLIGFAVSVLLEKAVLIQAVAPMVAAASVALMYGQENDPAHELCLSTAVSQAQILLARLVLVFGYNLLLLVASYSGFVLVVPEQTISTLLINWLEPMAFLSSVALALSLPLGSANGISVAYAIWLSRYVIHIPELSRITSALRHGLNRFWGSPTILLPISVLLLGLALLSAQRRQHSARV